MAIYLEPGVMLNLSVRGSSITANGRASWGIIARHVVGSSITTNNNAIHGIGAASIRATSLIVMNNGGEGVRARRVRLKDSTPTGNGTSDVGTRVRPRLLNTTCTHSTRLNSPPASWGVCSAD